MVLSFSVRRLATTHPDGLLILDALGIAMAANRYPFAATIGAGLAELAAIDGAPAKFHVIGSRDRLPLRDAIIANGALIHGLDFDDTHMASIVHATAVSLPVALSVGEAVDADGRTLLAAYLAASEVAIASIASAPFALGVGGTVIAGYALSVLNRMRGTAQIAEKPMVDSSSSQHQ